MTTTIVYYDIPDDPNFSLISDKDAVYIPREGDAIFLGGRDYIVKDVTYKPDIWNHTVQEWNVYANLVLKHQTNTNSD